MTDVYCVEAFQALTQHNILSAAEEKELLKSMPLKVYFCRTRETKIKYRGHGGQPKPTTAPPLRISKKLIVVFALNVLNL